MKSIGFSDHEIKELVDQGVIVPGSEKLPAS
jgi:hypothetical protein